jgi:hypothetical protein
MRTDKPLLPGWCYWACLIAVVALATYVIFHAYRFSLNSDGAVADLLARLAIEEGRLVPLDWMYSNGDLWILGPRLFLIIAYPWLGLGYPLHAAATWITYIYLLLVVYGACRIVAPERPRAAIIATTLAAGSLSTPNFEFVVGQGSYSLYAALALALYALVSRPPLRASSGRASTITLLLAATAAALVCISNATRGNITVIVPLISGWLVALLLFRLQRRRGQALGSGAMVLAIILGAIAGTLLYQVWLLPSVVNSSGAASFTLASPADMWKHILQLPSAWFVYFQIIGGWVWLSPLQRALQGLVWLLSIVLLLAPVSVLLTARRHGPALVTLSWLALACYGVTVGALVASNNLFDGPPSIRYATFGIYASLCVLAIRVDALVTQRRRGALALVALVCLVPVCTIAAWREEWTPGGITYAQRASLIASLEQHGVATLLATYWNAEVLDVLSDGRISAFPMAVNASTGLRRFGPNSPRYVTDAVRGKQAVALTNAEATPRVWARIDEQFGAPLQSYQSGPFQVAVYDQPLVEAFYGRANPTDGSIIAGKLQVALSATELASCRSPQPCHHWIEVTNDGSRILATAGAKPLRLGIHGVDAQGKIVEWDAGRIDFPYPIHAGQTVRVTVELAPLSNPRVADYQLCLLQERVAWYCDRTHLRAAGSGSP